MRHTIQFTWIWSLQIWHPFISNSFKWLLIEFGTLLMTKVWLRFGTILHTAKSNNFFFYYQMDRKQNYTYLCITGEIFLISTRTSRRSILTENIGFFFKLSGFEWCWKDYEVRVLIHGFSKLTQRPNTLFLDTKHRLHRF